MNISKMNGLLAVPREGAINICCSLPFAFSIAISEPRCTTALLHRFPCRCFCFKQAYNYTAVVTLAVPVVVNHFCYAND